MACTPKKTGNPLYPATVPQLSPPEQGGGAAVRRPISLGFVRMTKQPRFWWLAFGHVLIAASPFCGRFDDPLKPGSSQTRDSSTDTRIFVSRWTENPKVPVTQTEFLPILRLRLLN